MKHYAKCSVHKVRPAFAGKVHPQWQKDQIFLNPVFDGISPAA